MKHLSTRQQEECIEYVKQEMLIMDIDQSAQSPPKKKQCLANTSYTYMTEFYLNTENDDEDYVDQQCSSKAASHMNEIELYLKHGLDKTIITTDYDQENKEFNPLSFWKKKESTYPILAKVAARVLGVPATSAAVEREFSFAGNVITQKRARLSPDTVNDIVFNHLFIKYKQRFSNTNNKK
ncbi:unnamed protein product [Rotaria sordida]|uniref:HAT C-terminal dimerisation domain-containing protein n=1 Tax=Rotaria sordida TaxID=392033 RepID=A0A820BN77_9BILA|nr:unnamed protein product [Rotaria sordida]CAF4202498.1 unnamed protein product [Rotaria sordida]CAF4204106.1 unnamed protein product [Rotaria sordida]